MPETIIRQAVAGDVPAIGRLVREAYAAYVGRLEKPPGPMFDDYHGHVCRGNAWVLDRDGAVAGLLVLISGSDHLLLDNVAVSPAEQGRGLGRRLLSFAEVEARRRGHVELRLYTNAAMHENIILYGRCGWVEYARGEQAGYSRVFMRKTVSDSGA